MYREKKTLTEAYVSGWLCINEQVAKPIVGDSVRSFQFLSLAFFVQLFRKHKQ